MKKIICLYMCFVMLFVCCGCTNKNSDYKESQVIVYLPEENDDSLNGYRKDDSADTYEDTTSKTYSANTNTLIYHYTTCTYTSKISDANFYSTNSIDELIELGYRACKLCNPE